MPKSKPAPQNSIALFEAEQNESEAEKSKINALFSKKGPAKVKQHFELYKRKKCNQITEINIELVNETNLGRIKDYTRQLVIVSNTLQEVSRYMEEHLTS